MQPISSAAFSATPGPIPSDWLHPDWPAPAHVHALHTTRQGGCSAPPWDSFNLGRSVGDDPAAVEANWRALAQAVAGAGEQVRLPWLPGVLQPLAARVLRAGYHAVLRKLLAVDSA